MILRRALLLAVAGGLGASACTDAGVPELARDEVAPAEVTDPAEPAGDGVWMVGVELLDRAVNGRRRILIEVDGAAVTCVDGRPADPAALTPGETVEVERADNREVTRAVPPIIDGRRLVVVDCG